MSEGAVKADTFGPENRGKVQVAEAPPDTWPAQRAERPVEKSRSDGVKTPVTTSDATKERTRIRPMIDLESLKRNHL